MPGALTRYRNHHRETMKSIFAALALAALSLTATAQSVTPYDSNAPRLDKPAKMSAPRVSEELEQVTRCRPDYNGGSICTTSPF